MRSIIIRTSGRALAPFILLFGVYVTIFGYSSPGGGFQGGVLLASGIILILVTHGRREVERLASNISWLESFGAFAFLMAGLLGIVIGGAFLANITPSSSLMKIVLDIVVSLKVFAGVVALFVYLFSLEVERS
ncbi:MAG: MnhB domain-containing protein [Candidatus Saliniplasma sp.]